MSDRERVVERLQEAGLGSEDRFIDVENGEKRSVANHDDPSNRYAEPPAGNYGIYASARDCLVLLDVDDYADLEDRAGVEALQELPETLQQASPHAAGGSDLAGHNLYRVDVTDDGRLPAAVLADEFGASNPGPSWGEVRTANQYVVGAGSQLDGCDKEGCDKCATAEGGRYTLAADRAVATIAADTLVDVLRQDPALSDDEEEIDHPEPEAITPDAPTQPTAGFDDDRSERLEYALENDEKLNRLFNGRGYSDYDDDRSAAESALAMKLAFWFQGDEQAVRWAMNRAATRKWAERKDESYRSSILEAVDRVSEYYDPSSGDSQETPSAEEIAQTESWEQVRNFYQDPDLNTIHARQAAASKLLNEHHYATPRDTETIWKYDPDTGVYSPDGETHIQEVLSRELGAHYSQHERREIIGKIKAQSYIDREEFDGADDALLCCANGVLDLEERELREHSPDYYFTRGIPVEYDPDADAEAVESFLEEIVRREADKKTLLEIVGHALWPGYEYAKFLILFGEGRNGKSVFFDTVEAMLGEENVSGWELQKLSENRFAKSDLVGKFANVAPDMPATKLTELGTLKTLTGGDTTMAEDKGEPAFEFVNRATLMFGANRPPVIPEASSAIKRRLVPIRLPNEFTHADDDNPDARDRDELLAELTAEDQLSGLLNLALDGLDRLREQGDVSLPESHDERLEYYEQFSDPIKEFRVNCLENERGPRVQKAAVYDAYKRFCRAQDYSVKGENVFFRTLRQTTLTYDESRPEIDGERVRVLNDAKFTETGLEYASETFLEDQSEESDADRVSELAPGDEGVTVEARVESVDADQPPQIAQKATLRDTSDEIEAVAWNDSNRVLEAGTYYRIKNARVDEYEGERQLSINAQTGVEEISPGVGNAPVAEADEGQDRIDTAADGGAEIDRRDPGRAAEIAVETVRREGGEMQVATLVTRLAKSDDIPPDTAERGIKKAVEERGDLERDGEDLRAI